MRKSARRLLSLFTLVCLIVTQTLSVSAAAQSTEPRVYGSDRYKTSVAISQKGWSESQYAVIARGDNFADALCAGPLAKKYDAPILLTQPDKISNEVLAELKRLGVKNVFIVGGNGAVSGNVENVLKSSGIASIERIFGADRYETSVKIAEKLGSVDKMALATGSDFPDALSISEIASSMGMPILLTEKNALPDKVRSYIVSAGITESYVIGGNGVISDSVRNALPNAIRLGGKDRYETNVAVMNQFVDKLNFNKIYVAVGDGKAGDGFADALTGAALAAKDSSPLILAYKVLPKTTADFLKPKVFAQSQVYALGGEAVVPSSILDTIASYISQGLKGKVLSQAGVYGPQEGTETIAQNVIIAVRDVTLQNTIIEGDLIITEGVGDGDVTLKNVTVNGTTTIRGGGTNSVVMYNFKGKTVVVDVPDGRSVRLVAQGDTSVESLSMNSDGKLEESELTGNGFTDVVIPEGAEVILKGSFNTVDIKADNANVSVESGSINSLNISKGVAGAKVDIAKNAKVANLTANAPVKVSGEGTVHTANIKSAGVELAKEPDKINIDKGITAKIDGKDMDEDDVETPPAGGSGGGGSHHDDDENEEVAVTGISVDPTEMTLKVGKTKKITATVTPENATNKDVKWSSDKPKIATVENGTVTAIAEGTANIAVTTVDGNKQATCVVTVEAEEEEPGEPTLVDKDAMSYDENKVGEGVVEATDDGAVTITLPKISKKAGYGVDEGRLNYGGKDFNYTDADGDSSNGWDNPQIAYVPILVDLNELGEYDEDDITEVTYDNTTGSVIVIDEKLYTNIPVAENDATTPSAAKVDDWKLLDPASTKVIIAAEDEDGNEREFTFTAAYKVMQAPAPEVSGSIERDPANTGGDDLVVSIKDDTVTFTSGQIKWYPEDKDLDRAAGNRVGVQINAPADLDTSDVKVTIGETTYDWDNIEDGDGYFWWYPLVTEENREFTATVVWNEKSTQKFNVVIGEGVTLEAEEPEQPAKVKLTIESKGTEVSASVGSDYVATAIIPKGAIVDASEAKIRLEMTDIASLGIVGTRTHELTIGTGIEDKTEISLENFISDLLSLNTSTIKGKFGDNEVTYTLSRADTDKDSIWVMTPNTTEAARGAWMYLVGAMKVETFTDDDSQIFIPKGAYMIIGNQKLVFEKDLHLKNVTGDLSATEQAIRDASTLKSIEAEKGKQVELYMPASQMLRIGQSQAELTKEVYVKANGFNLSDDELNSILPGARDAQGVVGMITGSLSILNKLAKGMNEATINVDVQAVEAGEPKEQLLGTFDQLYYSGKGAFEDEGNYYGIETVVSGVYNIYLDKSNVDGILKRSLADEEQLKIKLGSQYITGLFGETEVEKNIETFIDEGDYFILPAVQQGYNNGITIKASTIGYDGTSESHPAEVYIVRE